MSIERLVSVISPPEHPVSPGSPDEWLSIEDALGTPLPQDYKDYIARFGSGGFHYGDFTFLFPFNPFSGRYNLIEAVETILKSYKYLSECFPHDYTFSSFPTPSGLLPWGRTDNGDELYWLTEGKPENWVVVVDDTVEFERFPLSMTEFLAKWISGEIKPQMAPDLPLETLVFRPQAIN